MDNQNSDTFVFVITEKKQKPQTKHFTYILLSQPRETDRINYVHKLHVLGMKR